MGHPSHTKVDKTQRQTLKETQKIAFQKHRGTI